jgi:hypothetical protein
MAKHKHRWRRIKPGEQSERASKGYQLWLCTVGCCQNRAAWVCGVTPIDKRDNSPCCADGLCDEHATKPAPPPRKPAPKPRRKAMGRWGTRGGWLTFAGGIEQLCRPDRLFFGEPYPFIVNRERRRASAERGMKKGAGVR